MILHKLFLYTCLPNELSKQIVQNYVFMGVGRVLWDNECFCLQNSQKNINISNMMMNNIHLHGHRRNKNRRIRQELSWQTFFGNRLYFSTFWATLVMLHFLLKIRTETSTCKCKGYVFHKWKYYIMLLSFALHN